MSDSAASGRPRTVQLEHRQADGGRHIDWMLDLDPAGEGPLVTFRLPRRLDELGPGQQIEAQRIADHRRRYLTYEGPLDGNRGSVARVAGGEIHAVQMLGDDWGLLVRWEGEAAAEPRAQRLRVQCRHASTWTVQVLEAPTPGTGS